MARKKTFKKPEKVVQEEIVAKPKVVSTSSFILDWKFLEKNIWILIGLLTIIGFGLRVYRLDFLTLWVDEYIHVMRARDFLLYGTGLLEGENNGVILTFFIVPLFKLFAINEFWARFPSVVFGSLSIPLIFYLGRMLFNTPVGLIAAFISTFSWYSIFWSRMARNYASFEFAYLLLIIVFWKLLESKQANFSGNNFFEKWGVSKKHLMWFFPVFVFAFLNHQLTFFFAFAAGSFASIVAVKNIIKNGKSAIFDKYSIILYPTILVSAIMFMPFLGDIVSPILLLFLPEKAVTWIIPNWEFISNMFNDPEKRLNSFNLYNSVLETDLPWLHFIGFAGLILGFFIRPKSAVFIVSFFVIPILLMSFIFRDPALPRYLLYIYPLFLISTGVAIYFLFDKLINKYLPNKLQSKGLVKASAYGLVLWLVFTDLPFKQTKGLINTEEHGMVAPKELSHWSFVDWKFPSNYVSNFLQPNDVVLSTVPKPTDFYLGINNSKRFRQRHLDTELRQYVMNDPPEGMETHAFTTDGFKNIVNSTTRGWLFADYYFYNALTDPEARQWAIENLEFHFDASKDGGVNVLSWDKTQPRSPRRSLLLVLGKGGKNASQELSMDMPNLAEGNKVRLVIDAEGVDHNQEAILVINKKNQIYMPKPRSNGREQIVMDLDKSWFRPKGNIVQFGYNEQKVKGLTGNIDFRKGFVIYNMTAFPSN